VVDAWLIGLSCGLAAVAVLGLELLHEE